MERRLPVLVLLALILVKKGLAGMLDFPYPNWDGTVLPAEGFAAFSDPAKTAGVPLLIGTNREETKIFQWLGGMDSADPLYQAQASLAALRWKAEGADSIADAILSGDPGRKVYLYRFDWGGLDAEGRSVQGGASGAKIGAAHGIELPFFLQTDLVFGNLLPLRIFTAAYAKGRKKLQAAIGSYLANFAATGDPNGLARLPGSPAILPAWEAWGAGKEPPFLVLDAGFGEARIGQGRGRTSLETAEAALRSYPEPLRSRLAAGLKWR